MSDVDSPRGGGTAFWPRSHLANHAYFRHHPTQFDGSYIYTEPVKSAGHRALFGWGAGDVSPTPVTMTGKAGDALLLHGLTTHVGSGCEAASQQARLALFARYSHREMRTSAPMGTAFGFLLPRGLPAY